MNKDDVYLALGLYEYNYKENIGQLLSHSDNALAQAKFKDSKIHLQKAEDAVEVMGKEAWRKIINEAIQNNCFNFVSWKAVNAKTKQTDHNALSLILNIDKDTTYYYGQFMAPANQAGLGNKIYKNILNKMFKTPDARLRGTTCSLRLPFDYLELNDTYEDMSRLFEIFAKTLGFKLIIENAR